jgi:hypothetical protein
VVVASIVAWGASAAAATLPGLTSESTAPPKVKPRQIIYSGDGSAFLAGAKKVSRHSFGSLKWSSWTKTGAIGSGGSWFNDCKPDCAAGTFHGYAVKLQASSPKVIAGKDVFTRLKVTYTGKKPGFVHHKTQTWTLRHTVTSAGTAFFWNFPS